MAERTRKQMMAQQSLISTKNLSGRTGGIFFYHYVQPFPPKRI